MSQQKPIFLINILTTLIVIMTVPIVSAEYRAYQYLVSGASTEQKSVTILTTSFTPMAMAKYHGIKKEKLYLLRTWVCPGHTAKKSICIPPYQQENLQSYLQSQQGVTP